MPNHDERQVNEHIDRLVALERVAKDFEVWRASIMVEHETLKAGVSNFRAFQTRGNQFFDRFEAIAEDSEKRRKRNWTVAVVVAPFILAALSYGCDRAIHVGLDFWEFTQEFKQAHPSEFKQKSLIEPPYPVLSWNQPQHAGNSAAYTARVR